MSLFSQPLKAPFRRCFVGIFCLLLCFPVNAEDSLSREDELKAAYIWNFIGFINWRDLGSGNLPSEIRICIDGSNDFVEFFRQLVGNRRVGKLQHSVEVLQLNAARKCELIYVRDANKKTALKLVGALGLDENTVIVADTSSIYFPGAAIMFYQENKKLRFEVDLKKINALNVDISSELLKLARIKR
ncbi:MAG: YfiR family protein [Rhodospirillaceae bacterium]|nr:YfiR family protein [Rhodospirillaceae bacterium]